MKSIHHAVCTILAGAVLCALLTGCMHRSAPSIPADVSSGEYRQRMIQWHQQHDRQPRANP